MKENYIPFTHPAGKRCSPSRVDFEAGQQGVKPWAGGTGAAVLQPRDTSPGLPASGCSSGTGPTTHPAPGTPSPPQAQALCPVSPVAPAPGPSSPSSLYGLTWGPEPCSPACTAMAPLRV